LPAGIELIRAGAGNGGEQKKKHSITPEGGITPRLPAHEFLFCEHEF
jgi:hypothetical protein